MIERVTFVSCVGKKRMSACAAKDIYESAWFLKARAFAERAGHPWFILSAEHGLLHPDAVVEPYERTLNTMAKRDRLTWAEGVMRQVQAELPDLKHATILAGDRYREFLTPMLKDRGVRVEVPMQGLRIGEQLRWLDRPR
jgi:hypothetical protein